MKQVIKRNIIYSTESKSENAYVHNLPYAKDWLSPYIVFYRSKNRQKKDTKCDGSYETVDIHFEKHNKGYEKKLLDLIKSEEYKNHFNSNMELKDIIMKSKREEGFELII